MEVCEVLLGILEACMRLERQLVVTEEVLRNNIFLSFALMAK